MPISLRSGNHFTMRAKRPCPHCHDTTWQMCCGYRYSAWPEPTVPASYKKELAWICEQCEEANTEIKQIYEPSDHTMIIKRLMAFTEDYSFINMTISSRPYEIIARIQVPDFDPGELRAIKEKQLETGFISAEELMRVRKAGFQRPVDLPPKPHPTGIRGKERARQRMFNGEPKSV
jgi:hypothetical protein